MRSVEGRVNRHFPPQLTMIAAHTPLCAFRQNDQPVHEGLIIAVRTLHGETTELRFFYPVTTVPEAGPKESLHYYVYKYSNRPPSRSFMRLDSNCIATAWARTTGVVSNPVLSRGMRSAV
jgi:hypothetical protein